MRFRRGRPFILILLIAAAILIFFVIRGGTKADSGPTVVLCPGPDEFGYSCRSGAGFAYIDATNDSLFYEDDGILGITLPFPFPFYGTSYTQVQVSSNGNIQFNSANPDFFNLCISAGPAPGMGDMIAPYWDDLDLRSYGVIEFETVGATPDRIFVIEWDGVPRYGSDTDDRVTFEVQLFEKNGDILFLYQDVTTFEGYNGSSATIGLQSEAQGSALQYGCLQPVVADASGIYFPHPSNPPDRFGLRQNAPGMIGLPADEATSTNRPTAKGDILELIEALNQGRPQQRLSQLREQWILQIPMRLTEYRWVDLSGDELDDLILIWRGDAASPDLDQLVILEAQPSGKMRLWLERPLSARSSNRSELAFHTTADLTGDGLQDVLLWDKAHSRIELIYSGADTELIEHQFPVPCLDKLLVSDLNDDGRLEIVGKNCHAGDRLNFSWNGAEFQAIGTADDD